MPKTLQLAQAISARFCHDLASAVGVIDNCIALMDHDNKEIGQKAKALMSDEAENLVNKVKFFRSAYGLSDIEIDTSLIHIKKLLTDFFKNTKVKLELQSETGLLYVDTKFVKSILCLAAIVYGNILGSGTVVLCFNKDLDNPFNLKGYGANLKLQDDNIGVINGITKAPINVMNCREHYVNKICNNMGYKVIVQKNPEMIEYKLIKKQ